MDSTHHLSDHGRSRIGGVALTTGRPCRVLVHHTWNRLSRALSLPLATGHLVLRAALTDLW